MKNKYEASTPTFDSSYQFNARALAAWVLLNEAYDNPTPLGVQAAMTALVGAHGVYQFLASRGNSKTDNALAVWKAFSDSSFTLNGVLPGITSIGSLSNKAITSELISLLLDVLTTDPVISTLLNDLHNIDSCYTQICIPTIYTNVQAISNALSENSVEAIATAINTFGNGGPYTDPYTLGLYTYLTTLLLPEAPGSDLVSMSIAQKASATPTGIYKVLGLGTSSETSALASLVTKVFSEEDYASQGDPSAWSGCIPTTSNPSPCKGVGSTCKYNTGDCTTA